MPLLSSDILEHQFGPTEVEILWQDDTTRIICTKATASGQVLELSRVVFDQTGISRFPDVHQEIVAGKSMGKAFAGRGIAFTRQVHAAHEYDRHDLPASFTKRFGTGEPPTVMNVSIIVGPENAPYADILEIYSPAVAWQLAESEMSDTVVSEVGTFGELLTRLGS